IPARLIELHQRPDVLGLRRAAKRAPRQRREDLAGADLFVPPARRTADENLAPARRVLRSLRVVRPLDLHLADAGVELIPRNLARRVQGPHERLVQLGARRVVGREECDADRVQPRFDRNTRRLSDLSGAAGTDLLVPVEELDALAVDRDLQLLALDLPQQVLELTRNALDLDDVVAVGRELVID